MFLREYLVNRVILLTIILCCAVNTVAIESCSAHSNTYRRPVLRVESFVWFARIYRYVNVSAAGAP